MKFRDFPSSRQLCSGKSHHELVLDLSAHCLPPPASDIAVLALLTIHAVILSKVELESLTLVLDTPSSTSLRSGWGVENEPSFNPSLSST